MAGAWQPPKKPNERFKVEEQIPDDAKQDADFMKAVQDLRATQATHRGWLSARGAFDKGDLLYLKDQEERRRHMEEALQDKERSEFLAQRQRLEEEAEKQAAAKAKSVQQKREQQDVANAAKKKRALPLVKVVPVAKDGQNDNVAVKKQRTTSEGEQKVAPDGTQNNNTTEAAVVESEIDEVPAVGLGDLLGGYASSSDTSDNEEERLRDGGDDEGT